MVTPNPKPDLAAAAKLIRESKLECGLIALWGGLMVRPSDNFYALLDATATANSIVLRLQRDDGPIREIEIIEPTGIEEVSKERLLIRNASAVHAGSDHYAPVPRGNEPALLLEL